MYQHTGPHFSTGHRGRSTEVIWCSIFKSQDQARPVFHGCRFQVASPYVALHVAGHWVATNPKRSVSPGPRKMCGRSAEDQRGSHNLEKATVQEFFESVILELHAHKVDKQDGCFHRCLHPISDSLSDFVLSTGVVFSSVQPSKFSQ
jgi:hypothetical protein